MKKDNLISTPPQETPVSANKEQQLAELQAKIQRLSAEINETLVKNNLELVVLHDIRYNQELKQEEIGHNISLKPKMK